jgi:RNA polymerase sigma-70 factor (ECF subfamily)
LSRDRDKTAAFMALLTPLQRQLEVSCRRMLRDRSAVEDVLQAAVTAAFSQFDRYAEGTNFRAWMFRFVTNEALNRNRRRDPAPWGEFPLEAAVEPEEFPAPGDLAAMLVERPGVVREHLDGLVARALDELPPAERTVLLLRAVGEFSYQEIHTILAIPVGSVMGYLSRARLKLRQSLAGYAAERGVPGLRVTEEKRP